MNKITKIISTLFVVALVFFVLGKPSEASAKLEKIEPELVNIKDLTANFDLSKSSPAKQEVEFEKNGQKVIAGLERIDDYSTLASVPNGYSSYRIYWKFGIINSEYHAEIYVNPTSGLSMIKNLYGAKVSGVGYTFSNKSLKATRKIETSAFPARAALTFKATLFIEGFPYTTDNSLTMTIKNKVLTSKFE